MKKKAIGSAIIHDAPQNPGGKPKLKSKEEKSFAGLAGPRGKENLGT